jgi:hypothetical protein
LPCIIFGAKTPLSRICAYIRPKDVPASSLWCVRSHQGTARKKNNIV